MGYRYKFNLELYIIGSPITMYYGYGTAPYPFGITIINPTKIPVSEVEVMKSIFEWGVIFDNKEDAIKHYNTRAENCKNYYNNLQLYEYPIATIKTEVKINKDNNSKILDFLTSISLRNNNDFELCNSHMVSIELPNNPNITKENNEYIKDILSNSKEIDLQGNFLDPTNNIYYSYCNLVSKLRKKIPKSLKIAEMVFSHITFAQNKDKYTYIPSEVIDIIVSFIVGEQVKRFNKNKRKRKCEDIEEHNYPVIKKIYSGLQELYYKTYPQMEDSFYTEDKKYTSLLPL